MLFTLEFDDQGALLHRNYQGKKDSAIKRFYSKSKSDILNQANIYLQEHCNRSLFNADIIEK